MSKGVESFPKPSATFRSIALFGVGLAAVGGLDMLADRVNGSDTFIPGSSAWFSDPNYIPPFNSVQIIHGYLKLIETGQLPDGHTNAWGPRELTSWLAAVSFFASQYNTQYKKLLQTSASLNGTLFAALQLDYLSDASGGLKVADALQWGGSGVVTGTMLTHRTSSLIKEHSSK